jgi:alcohol dehydrogenase class IV
MPPSHFDLAGAGRIVFGSGSAHTIPGIARSFGRRAFVVTGRSPDRAAWLTNALHDSGVAAERFPVEREPTLDLVRRGVVAARGAGCDFVIGLGGGSAIDAAKAIAALTSNTGDVLDYVEVIGKGQPLTHPPLPCIAVPTTAGTGAEVTRNAVIGSPADRVKVSLRHPLMQPRVAVVDPDLTIGMPPSLTAATGLDAITQLIEGFVTRRANAFTDALALEGLRYAAASIRRAVADGTDRDARSGMALASLFSGLVLANAGLGAVHGLAAGIGGMFDAPPGAVCGVLLPLVFASNLEHMAAGGVSGDDRCRRIAAILTGRDVAGGEDGGRWLHALVGDLATPRLSAYGMTAADIPAVVERAQRANSTKGNPVALTDRTLSGILEAAL